MNERRGTFEDDLTEETLPDAAQREEAAHDIEGDPDVDSQADDRDDKPTT